MHVDEVEVVLDEHAVDDEGGVMVHILVNLDTLDVAQQLVGALLLAKLPDVDVATLSVFGRGVVEAHAVAFEQHQTYVMLVVEGRQLADEGLVLAVTLRDVVDADSPLQPECSVGHQLGGYEPLAGDALHAIPRDGHDAMLRRETEHLAPDVVHAWRGANYRLATVPRGRIATQTYVNECNKHPRALLLNLHYSIFALICSTRLIILDVPISLVRLFSIN